MLPQAARRARDARLQRPPGVAGAGVPWCAGRGGTQQAVAAFLLAGARGGSLASVRVGGQVTVQKEGPQGPCTSGVAARCRPLVVGAAAVLQFFGGGFAMFNQVLQFLSRRQRHASFLRLSSVLSLPPSHPGAELFVAVMDPRGTTAKRQKWGRFLPHQRANVDQVPLPFVNDMEDTLDEEKGADRVEIDVCV